MCHEVLVLSGLVQWKAGVQTHQQSFLLSRCSTVMVRGSVVSWLGVGIENPFGVTLGSLFYLSRGLSNGSLLLEYLRGLNEKIYVKWFV